MGHPKSVQIYLGFELVELRLGDGVSLGDDRDDVDLTVQLFHGHQVKSLQSEEEENRSRALRSVSVPICVSTFLHLSLSDITVIYSQFGWLAGFIYKAAFF